VANAIRKGWSRVYSGAPWEYGETLYGDYLVPSVSFGRGASAPDYEAFVGTLYQPAFAGTGATVEQAYWSIHILHDIKANSTPTLHIHWGHNIASGTYTPGTASVKWYVDISVAKGYGAGSFSETRTLSVTQTAGAQYSHHITDDDSMTITEAFEPDALILGRVYRDPAQDDFGYDAFIFQMDLHYAADKAGTIERNRPFSGF